MPIPICSGLPCILKTSLDSKTRQLHIADFEPNMGRHAARNILERVQGSPVEMRCPGCHAPHSRTRSKILGMARADLNKGSQTVTLQPGRSEERRVGKERRLPW